MLGRPACRDNLRMEQFLTNLEKWFEPHVLGELLLDWTGRAVAAIAIFVIGRLIASWLSRWLTATMRRVGRDETLARFFGSLGYIVLVVMVVLTAVNALGVPTTNFLAIVGAAGLAIGLALKDSLSNFSSGVMIIRAWVATADVGRTRSDLLERIKSALGDGGFNTPYPRMRLEHPPQAAQ